MRDAAAPATVNADRLAPGRRVPEPVRDRGSSRWRIAQKTKTVADKSATIFITPVCLGPVNARRRNCLFEDTGFSAESPKGRALATTIPFERERITSAQNRRATGTGLTC